MQSIEQRYWGIQGLFIGFWILNWILIYLWKDSNYYWISGHTGNGTCFRTQAVRTEALSPALLDFQNGHISNSWSLLDLDWEPMEYRRCPTLRKAQSSPTVMTLITGFVFLLISFVITYIIDKKSSILFNTCDDIGPQQTLSVGC